jgi:LysR family transcriptional regulator, transcriptional activator for aaeXAB operon
VTDEAVEVIRDRIDLAITISRPLRDSSLVRHHLADWPLVLCASPAYLRERGTPRSPDDLASHDLLALPAWHHGSDVLTGPDGKRHRVAVRPRITTNNQFSIRQLTLMGMGLSFHAEPEIAEELAAGRLVRVLPDWSADGLSVDVLMPARGRQPAKIRMALDALRRYLDRAEIPRPAPRQAERTSRSRRSR